jgi:hypothetical protein
LGVLQEVRVVTAGGWAGHVAGFGERLRQLLAQRSVIAWAPLLGALLASSAVGRHYVFDDYVLGLIARGKPQIAGLVRDRWDLFNFTTGEPALNRQLMDQGLMLPWWSDDQLKIAFYRPLSALLHHLEFSLWPDAPRAMYLQSLAWLGLVTALVACLYRELESTPWLAGLAALLFAVDDSHGAVVAWLSNRNALIASVFGLVALLAHHAWRKRGQRWGALLAPLSWMLALSAGEFAVGTVAYLVSYALFLDRARPWRRVGTLLPYVLVAAVWGVVYARSGAAVHGSGSYVSPWLDFVRFSSVAPLRLSGLLAATLGPSPAELLLLGRPEHFVYWAALVAAVLAAAACALMPMLRCDRTARFWLVGMLLAIVPVTASFPSDRLLLLASVGGMGLLARVTAPLLEASAWQTLGTGRALLCLVFGGAHLLLAPLCLPLRAAQMQLVGRTLEVATAGLDRIPELEKRTVVILSAPLDVLASYIQAERAWRHVPRAKHLYWLTTAGSSLRVTRTDPNTLLIERSSGFLSTPLERHYRDQPDTLKRGEPVRLGPLVASVVSVTSDGKPLAVSFRFAERLESRSYVFLVWQDGRYQPLSLDRFAWPLQLPAEDLGQILLRTALGSP